jgi:hypothetical protein
MPLARLAVFVFFAAALGISAAIAEDSTENYTLEKTDKGYVRMDKRTGEMSVCEITGSQMICRMGADDRKAFESELDTLMTRVEALEKKVAALEGGSPPAALNRLPNDEEMEQTFTFMEKFFRRFMGIAKDLERDFGGEKGETPVPNKT